MNKITAKDIHEAMKKQDMLSQASKVMKKQNMLMEASKIIRQQMKDLHK